MEKHENTVLLYTGLGAGHLGPMAVLAKLLLRHGVSPSAVIVVFLESPVTTTNISSFVSKVVTASHPSVTFHTIHASDVAYTIPAKSGSFASDYLPYITAANANLLALLRSLPAIRALVFDFFFVDALDVAGELQIPSYALFTSGVSSLSTFLYLQNLRNELQKPAGAAVLNIPGLPPIPSSHLPESLIGNEELLDVFAERFNRLIDADGILVNSFADREPAALMAVSGGLCVDSGRRMNPVHCIGPMIADPDENRAPGSEEKRHECLDWLDSQPEKSVVFLCFGSAGAHSGEQLTEMAVGLERSGQRFLWTVRSPRDGDGKMRSEPPELGKLLPEGFVERNSSRGMVVKSWAPQVEVLRHPCR